MEIKLRYDGKRFDNGYVDTEPAPIFMSYEEMRRSMQAQLIRPKPIEVKHVVLDADDTIWEVEPWGIATLATPIGHTKKDTLPVRLNISKVENIPEFWIGIAPAGSVTLRPHLRETLSKLKQRGIPVSIASCNDKESIERYLDAFGLKGEFTDIEAYWLKSKDQMVQDIARRNNVDTSNILFVDDDPINAMDVSTATDAMPLVLGYDIKDIDEILEFIK